MGGGADAWLHQVNIKVEGLPSIDINVAFTDSSAPDLSILGQRGFFDNFQIRFQRYKNQIEIFPRSTSVYLAAIRDGSPLSDGSSKRSISECDAKQKQEGFGRNLGTELIRLISKLDTR